MQLCLASKLCCYATACLLTCLICLLLLSIIIKVGILFRQPVCLPLSECVVYHTTPHPASHSLSLSKAFLRTLSLTAAISQSAINRPRNVRSCSNEQNNEPKNENACLAQAEKTSLGSDFISDAAAPDVADWKPTASLRFVVDEEAIFVSAGSVLSEPRFAKNGQA